MHAICDGDIFTWVSWGWMTFQDVTGQIFLIKLSLVKGHVISASSVGSAAFERQRRASIISSSELAKCWAFFVGMIVILQV
jgi:hypothetical protein